MYYNALIFGRMSLCLAGDSTNNAGYPTIELQRRDEWVSAGPSWARFFAVFVWLPVCARGMAAAGRGGFFG
jgi:hypothetical protein